MTYNKALHRYAVFTAVCTFLLIIAGGLVTSTESGLAVPDWPLSYGQIMPPMVGGIFYEHGHRMIASFVGMLTIILAVWFWKSDHRRWVRVLALGALGSVVLQGILGGLTVLYLLPAPLSVSHATLAQTFFVMVCSLALFSSRWWGSEQPLLKGDSARSFVRASLFLVTAVYVQLILGALMRHTQAGLAIPDFPLAYGQIVPSLSDESIAEYNRFQLSNDLRLAADGPLRFSQILVHILHRFWALVVGGLVLLVSIRARKLGREFSRLRTFGLLLIGLVTVQIALGAFTVLLRKEFLVTTAHVATGAAILVTSVLLTLHAMRYARLSWKKDLLLQGKQSEVVA